MRRHIFQLLLLYSILGSLFSCEVFDQRNLTPVLLPADVDSLRNESAELRVNGQAYRDKSDYPNALLAQQRALEISLLLQDTANIINDYNQLGTTYRRLSRLESALHNHSTALSYSEIICRQDTSMEALKNYVMSLNGLGNVHLSMSNYELAERCFRVALSGEKTLNSHLGMAINYANIGGIKYDINELDSARWYFDRSMEENKLISSAIGIGLCHVSYGNIYTKQDSLLAAEKEYRTAARMMMDIQDKWHAAEPIMALSKNCISRHDLDEALIHLTNAKTIADELQSFELQSEVAGIYAMLYEALGDYRNALESQKLSYALNDSIENWTQMNRVREICLDYEMRENRSKMEYLENALEDNKNMHTVNMTIFIVLLIAALIIIVLLYYTAQSRQKRYEALDKLETMRTTFFRNLTHEFRTPLTVITGLADQLRQENMAESQRLHFINSIKQQSNSLLELVNQLLSITKLMAGFEQREWRHGDVVAFFHMTMTGYTDFAKMREIQLNFDHKKEIIEMDFVPDYYEKIISNLLGNAFKFTPSGGSITVSVDYQSGHLVLDVIDTGQGVSIVDQPHIFELFYQGQQSTKQGSTGIGLPYVYQMVRQMGGIITCEQNLPKGTIMHIVVPGKCPDETVTNIQPWQLENSYHHISRSQSPNNVSTQISGSLQNNIEKNEAENEENCLPLVLVVEDNPDISDYIALLLNSRYRVIKAYDGYEALRLLGNNLPDLIITDLMMPGLDGYELCKSVRLSPVLSDVPIIIISARAEDADRVKGYEDGADGYLVKPFNPEELFALISRLLNQRDETHKHLQQLIAKVNELKADSSANRVMGKENEDFTYDGDDKAFLRRLNSIIEKQMLEGDVLLDTIAASMCTSRSTLARRVKEITGSAPSTYILQLRLERARKLLEESQLSIGEIALSCGFDDLSYFSRVFKHNYDLTPTRFRLKKNL